MLTRRISRLWMVISSKLNHIFNHFLRKSKSIYDILRDVYTLKQVTGLMEDFISSSKPLNVYPNPHFWV